MKPCLSCRDTSPDDARFCITCGHAFIVTQRMSSAGAQTMRLDGDGPSSVASAQGAEVGSTSVVTTSNGYTFSVGTVFLPNHVKAIYTNDKQEPIAYIVNGSIVKVQS